MSDNQISWKEIGPALNNQCPVCGTMAEPYKRQPYDGLSDGTVIIAPRMTFCRNCRACFVHYLEEAGSDD